MTVFASFAAKFVHSLRPSWQFAGMDKLITYVPKTLPYLRPYWQHASISAATLLLITLVSLLMPWPMALLVDSVLGKQPLPPAIAQLLGPLAENRSVLLFLVVGAQFALTLISNGLAVLHNYATTKVDVGMTLDFRGELFQHAQRLSLAYHDRRRSGMLMYVINTMDSAPVNFIMALLPFVQDVLVLVGMLWITARLDWRVAVIGLLVVLFLYSSVGYYTKHIQMRIREVAGMEGGTLAIIHEAMAMLRVIVAFGREDHEYSRFRKQGEHANEARVQLTVRQSLFSLFVDCTTAAGTALVLGYGAYQVLLGQLTTGELLVVMAYLAAVYSPLESISSTLGSFQQQLVGLDMAFKLLETEPDVKEAPNAVTIARAKGRITFAGVNFSYQDRTDTLTDITFDVQPGQAIALVGPTGAGKTTLASLIPRFYDAQHGRILLDGQDIRELTIRSLREQISIVLQEPLLFSASIADNIRYGRLDADMDAIQEAAKAANAHDFIMALPEQYETSVGERGAQLSGGERQRIALARAFLKDAPILILDEPTSSIDSKTEAVILNALDRLMMGRTTFLVSHRLATIHGVDRILVLNRGRLVEQGTHDELLLQGGLYKQLFDLQTMKQSKQRSAGRGKRAVQDYEFHSRSG